MSRSFFKLCCLMFLSEFALAQELDLGVSQIPDSLKKNASMITRKDERVFTVSSIEKATLSIHEIRTIMDETGDSYLSFHFQGDKFRKLGDVDIKVYDASGKQINRYKKKDLSTFNMGEGLIDDATRNYMVISTTTYPITVEFEYDIEFKGTLMYPDYRFCWPQISIINSSFTVVVPRSLGFRYKAKNTTLSPVIKQEGDKDIYRWAVSNQPAITYEDGAVSSGKGYPYIMLAPKKFKLDAYEGDLSTWQSFGIWYNSVIEGTDRLSDERKAFYRDMVKDAASDREKAKIIYDYMQKNFRYVSIQLGIGGLRPLPASFTDEKKYGDCKGLSMYMHACLKAVGVKSYMVIINRESNDEEVDKDFASNRFNHVILMMPDGKDTVWLECTSKTALFGHLDITTQNKNAVVATEKGGVLVPTPRTRAKDNAFVMNTMVQLEEDGSGVTKSSIQATGEYKEEMLHYLADSKDDDQKQYLVRRIGYKQPDELLIKRLEDPVMYKTEITMAMEKVSEFSAGSKMFLAPHIYKFWSLKMPNTAERKRNYYFENPFLKVDTTVFRLPEGYSVDVLPECKTFNCENANYEVKYSYNAAEKAVYSITVLELKKHCIAPAEYSAIRKFFDQVLKEESQRIVIKKEI